MKALFERCGGNNLVALDDAQAFSSFLDIHVPNVVNNDSLGLFNDSFVIGPQVDGA
jgi:hypothetical protein